MPSGFTQEDRFLKLNSPLGDAMLIEAFTVSERVSDCFEIEIDTLVELGKAVDPRKLLGQPVTIRVRLNSENQQSRYFNGIVREVHVGTESERFQGFRLSVVPKLWVTNLSQNFRVFEKKKVPDILKEILQSYGITATSRLTRTYTEWDM